jgi:hypothetical protein
MGKEIQYQQQQFKCRSWIKISSNQNIVLTGYFNGTADFGNMQMTSTDPQCMKCF